MDEKTRKVLQYLQTEVKKSIDAHYAVDCCIAATKVTLDVLTHFQIEANPVVTRTLIFNSVFREWVEKNDRVPEREEMPAVLESGGWSMMLGAPNGLRTSVPTKGVGFAGHLIAHLPKEHIIVDLSLPQATRPRYKMRLYPFVAKVGPEFIEQGWVSFKYPQKEGGDLLLTYAIISNDRYTEARDWQSDGRKVVSFPAIAEIDQMLRAEEDGTQSGGRESEEATESPPEVRSTD